MTTLISAAQIAEALGISVASARQRLWRAGLREQRGYDPGEVAAQFRINIGKIVATTSGSTESLSPAELERLRREVGA
jgi:hypothetical protein